MINYSIPACFFPSTVFFLGSSAGVMKEFLSNRHLRFFAKFFTASSEAESYLKNLHYNLVQFTQYCLLEHEKAKGSDLIKNLVNDEMSPIHAEIYNPARFAEVSVLVVDYRLEDGFAFDFLSKLNNHYVKVILVVDAKDEPEVLLAKEAGLIDDYILSSNADFLISLVNQVDVLAWEYFLSVSKALFRLFSFPAPNCLQNREFAQFFQFFCHEKSMIEFYLIDKEGIFLLMNQQGEFGFLSVMTAAALDDFAEFLALQGGPAEMVADLKNGFCMPAFKHEIQANTTSGDWSKRLFHAKSLKTSTETYYYTWIEEKQVSAVHQSTPSYHQYFNDLTAVEGFL